MQELQQFIEELERKAEKNNLFHYVEDTKINIWYVIARLRKIMLHIGVKLKEEELELVESNKTLAKLDEYREENIKNLKKISELFEKISELTEKK